MTKPRLIADSANNNSIDGDRLADDSIDENKLSGGIDGAKLLDGSITSDKLSLGAISASSVSYTVPFTGGEERTVEARLKEVVNVTDFGAIATQGQPSLAVAQANTEAFARAFAASGHVYVPGNKPNLTYYVTDTINVAGGRLEGSNPGNFGNIGVTIRCHSGYNVNNPLIRIGSGGRVEEIELIGISSSNVNEVPIAGIEISSTANRISVYRLRAQFFRNGIYADNTQNSLFSECQIKFCPEACYYLNELENCKFVNINSDQDKQFTAALSLTSRNILIDNVAGDPKHSRNLSFYMGIHERGNNDIDHCLEVRGGGGIGLLFVDGEYNGGRKSAINAPSGCTLVNPKFTLIGTNLAVTNATAFTETSAGSGVFYPSSGSSGVSISLPAGGSFSGTGGKVPFQLIPKLSESTLCSDKFGFTYSSSLWSGSSGGSVEYLSSENALKISGATVIQGGKRSAFTTTNSPMPPTLQLAGRNYKIVIKVRSFVNCSGVRVYATRPSGAGFRRLISTFNSEGYHEAVVSANASDDTTNYDLGAFELTPSGITSGTASFLVEIFSVSLL